jgi:hypothetical protein
MTAYADDTVWTPERIRALGARTDVPTAASIFGICQTQGYDYVKQGRFPVPVIPIGGKPGRPRRIVVPVAPILKLLGLDDANAPRDAAHPAA